MKMTQRSYIGYVIKYISVKIATPKRSTFFDISKYEKNLQSFKILMI